MLRVGKMVAGVYNAFEKFYKSNNKTDFTLPEV